MDDPSRREDPLEYGPARRKKAARFAGVDPEDALNAACEKFIRRYAAVEQGAAGRGVPVSDLTLAEMTDLWNGAKQRHDSDGF